MKAQESGGESVDNIARLVEDAEVEVIRNQWHFAKLGAPRRKRTKVLTKPKRFPGHDKEASEFNASVHNGSVCPHEACLCNGSEFNWKNVTSRHDKTLRRWERTQEPLVLEDEENQKEQE